MSDLDDAVDSDDADDDVDGSRIVPLGMVAGVKMEIFVSVMMWTLQEWLE